MDEGEGRCDAHARRGRPCRWPGLLLGSVIIAAAPATAMAESCKSDGGLVFLGKSNKRSAWLSATGAGAFELEAAQGSQIVDEWDRSKRGLRFSLSPVVSNGNGGTHKLYELGGKNPCLIDTQNQKRSFVFPPNVTLPSRPGGVVPPIGILPPTGITPGLPGGVMPPIGTLPPGGLMPGIPGGVVPPIAVLPPTGITPGLPGGVMPPIGTLPPDGVTPGEPGVGASSGGVSGQGTGTSVGVNVPPGYQHGRVLPPTAQCIDPRYPDGTVTMTCTSPIPIGGEVAITPGRQFDFQSPWNTWMDARFVNAFDGRYGLDTESLAGVLTIGIDRRLSDDLVAGFSVSIESGQSDGYGGTMHSDFESYTAGPYVALRLSPRWAVDASASYSFADNNLELASLDGSYDSQQYSGSINVHGQYDFGAVGVRPKASLFYAHTAGDAYVLDGKVFGRSVSLQFPESDFGYGVTEASVEINRLFTAENGMRFMPYAEFGVDYEFERPNDGAIMTGDLTLATPSPWAGSARAGLRTLISETAFLEASAGYLSIGQDGLDAWEGRLYASFGF